MTTQTAIELGQGVLNWSRYERIGDRYGTVNLTSGGDDWPSAREQFKDAPLGSHGTLKAEILEGRQSQHIGDLAHGLVDKGPLEPGTEVELGHGKLFIDEEMSGIGLKPDREMAMEGLTYTGDFDDCVLCDGSGYGPEAQQISDTFYCLEIRDRDLAERLSWHRKIGQAEVDHLIKEGRLYTWNDAEKRWDAEPLTAAAVNARSHPHDAINRMILIRFRCERLGIEVECRNCNGHGNLPPEGVDREADRPLPADRETWWLNPPALYSVHQQVVRLIFEPDAEQPDQERSTP